MCNNDTSVLLRKYDLLFMLTTDRSRLTAYRSLFTAYHNPASSNQALATKHQTPISRIQYLYHPVYQFVSDFVFRYSDFSMVLCLVLGA
jgi:hypothetical protein